MSFFCFFFFKQKTAYEMRICDWSSDVCSSDLHFPFPHHEGCRHRAGKTRRWRMPAYAQQAVRTYTYRVGVAASPFMHRRQYRICDADIIKQRLATRRIMGQSCEFPPGECSYGTGKVKLRPRHIFWVFPGVGEQPQGKRSKQQQHKCRFEDGFEIHGPMTRRGRSSCSKKTEPGRGTNVKHDALVCCPVDRKIEQEMRSRPFTELVLKGAPP